jgi:sugar (pentulose or hexulose) kinase
LDAFLGIDLGTSGCRAVAIDPRGEIIAQSRCALPASQAERAGESRQQPAAWWAAVRRVLGDLAKDCRGTDIRALAVDGTSASLLLCDPQGEPLTPGLMYDDTSARNFLPELTRFAPADSPVLSPASSLAKLLLLGGDCKHAPFHALHQADWILGRLCGRYGLSDESNCLKLGYDPLARRWPEWLQSLPLPPACLPRVFPCGTPVGTLRPSLAKELGLAGELRIVTGTTDGNAAFLAAGADQIGDAVTSLGSTLVLKILSSRPVFASEFGVYSHRLGDRWLLGGASNSGGAVCRAFFSDEEMARLSSRLQPQRPTGLDYYPLLRPGERFPVNDSELPPRLRPRPADDARFFQAILEGITRIEQAGYELLHRLGAPQPRRILTTGGGAVNEPWRQMREAALGIPVLRAPQQGAAYGAALLAKSGVSGLSFEL